MTDATLVAPSGASRSTRATLVGVALLLVLALSAFGGLRYGLLLAIGLGFGLTLEGLRFGFAGPWRAMILRRDPAGLLAQLLSIALVAVVAIPLIDANGTELIGAHAPVGWAMIGGAFVFGACMQIVLGCGSGTLVNSGSGNPVSALALPFFAIGSFAGAYHLVWWTGLGSAPLVAFTGTSGLVITLVGLGVVALGALWLGAPGTRRLPRRLLLAAGLLAVLALANLVVGGQPWGVVYGLGLWAAKGATALGADLTGSVFWSLPTNQTRIAESVLTDVTSLTNLGIIGGAFIVAVWRSGLSARLPDLPARAWVGTVIAGFLLGFPHHRFALFLQFFFQLIQLFFCGYFFLDDIFPEFPIAIMGLLPRQSFLGLIALVRT